MRGADFCKDDTAVKDLLFDVLALECMPLGERLSASWVVGLMDVQTTLRDPCSSTLSSLRRQHFKVRRT